MRQRASEHCDPWTESRTLPHPITSSVFQRQVFCNPQPSDRKARPFFHHIYLRQMLLLSSLTAITAVSGRMSGERVVCVCFFGSARRSSSQLLHPSAALPTRAIPRADVVVCLLPPTETVCCDHSVTAPLDCWLLGVVV